VEIQKVYVRSDGTAIVKCNHCGVAKTVNAAKAKKSSKACAVRCSCRAIFQVFFDYRSVYRKKANFDGSYARLPYSSRWCGIWVKSLSMKGICFTTANMRNLKKGDRVKVRFALDGTRHSEMKKDAIVKWIKQKNIGCEFIDTGPYDKMLGFHLMP
jgi:hypothetical protein